MTLNLESPWCRDDEVERLFTSAICRPDERSDRYLTLLGVQGKDPLFQVEGLEGAKHGSHGDTPNDPARQRPDAREARGRSVARASYTAVDGSSFAMASSP